MQTRRWFKLRACRCPYLVALVLQLLYLVFQLLIFVLQPLKIRALIFNCISQCFYLMPAGIELMC